MNCVRNVPGIKNKLSASLRQMTLEEVYELADAITEENWKGIKEELGDLLLHIVFYARIAKEEQQFTLDEMIHSICDKLVARHPHIYGSVEVNDEEDVKRNWENLKLKEGKTSVLVGCPQRFACADKSHAPAGKSKTGRF